MPDDFDAYHKWLGIPPAEQPPDHYRLLGIQRFETDRDVISGAADRQMAYVRSLQAGQHASLTQELLNELSRARICLLDSAHKARYDAVLKSAVPADSISAMLPPRIDSPTAQGSPGSPTVGGTVGPYRLLERTSAASATWCYKAQDERSGHLVTVKTLAPDASASNHVVQRFRREIDLSTKLDHPNLIVGLDRGEQGGGLILAPISTRSAARCSFSSQVAHRTQENHRCNSWSLTSEIQFRR